MAESWIVPCNIKHFDLMEHFKSSETVVWHNSFTIRKGDTAYIYLSAPYSEIKYRCAVIEDQVDEETLNANAYAIPRKQSNNYFSKKVKYIVLRLEYEYPDGVLKLEDLREHGLGQVQIQARTDRRVQSYIIDITKECEEKGGTQNG